MKIILSILLSLLSAVSFGSDERVVDSLVHKVKVPGHPNWGGTAFLVAIEERNGFADVYFLTNYHVVAGAPAIMLLGPFTSDQDETAILVGHDQGKDLAVLQLKFTINQTIKDFKASLPVYLSKPDLLKTGSHPLRIVGFDWTDSQAYLNQQPTSIENGWNEHSAYIVNPKIELKDSIPLKVSNECPQPFLFTCYKLTAITWGYSGSPVVIYNKKSNQDTIIGVISHYSPFSPITYAIPIASALESLQKIIEGYQTSNPLPFVINTSSDNNFKIENNQVLNNLPMQGKEIGEWIWDLSIKASEAGNDHTPGGNDHTPGGNDHTPGGNDHTPGGGSAHVPILHHPGVPPITGGQFFELKTLPGLHLKNWTDPNNFSEQELDQLLIFGMYHNKLSGLKEFLSYQPGINLNQQFVYGNDKNSTTILSSFLNNFLNSNLDLIQSYAPKELRGTLQSSGDVSGVFSQFTVGYSSKTSELEYLQSNGFQYGFPYAKLEIGENSLQFKIRYMNPFTSKTAPGTIAEESFTTNGNLTQIGPFTYRMNTWVTRQFHGPFSTFPHSGPAWILIQIDPKTNELELKMVRIEGYKILGEQLIDYSTIWFKGKNNLR